MTASKNSCRAIFVIVVSVILTINYASPACADFVPVYKPEMSTARATGPIVIDGVLDDEGWIGVSTINHFTEHNPGDQVEPAVQTEAMITYDELNIYVAFVCYDDPATIRASFCERDNIYNDDFVIFGLDTYGDAANAYEFVCNPYGIQGDLYYSAGAGEDGGYDFVFDTAARVTEDGWVAEFAIPFASLRFPNVDEQLWKVNFSRNRPREVRQQYASGALDRDDSCWVCQWGTLTGVTGVTGGKGIKLLPAFVAHQAGSRDADGNFANEDIKGELSFSGTYDISSNIAAEITVNPDFSQVESDANQIDVNSKYALYYEEKRPFFQAGSDLFSTWFSAVYTRAINDPTVAGKVTGRVGDTSFAFLSAQDEHSAIILPFEEGDSIVAKGKSVSNIVRLRQTLGEMSHIGIVATDRRYEGDGSGSLVGIDSSIRLNQAYQIEIQAINSFTSEPNDTLLTAGINDVVFDGGAHTAAFDGESFTGRALYTSLERNGRSWAFDVDYWDRSPTFRTDNGFETSNNSRLGSVSTEYLFRFDNSRIWRTLQPSLSVSRKWNYDGQTKEEDATFGLEGSLRKAQTSFHGRAVTGSELYSGVQLDNIWIAHMCMNSRPSGALRWGGWINYGHRPYYKALELGRQTDYGLWCDYKPLDRLTVELRWSRSLSKHLDNDSQYYSGYTNRARVALQMTHELAARVIVQYSSFDDRWEADPLLSYQLNPFSIFYIGSTRDYGLVSIEDDRDGINADSWQLQNRQYFLKFQYLFQL